MYVKESVMKKSGHVAWVLFFALMGLLLLASENIFSQEKSNEGAEKLKWTFDFGAWEARNKVTEDFSAELAVGDYLNGAIAVASDGTIYFTTINGFLFALDSNGKLKWMTGGRKSKFSANGTPVIGKDGTIYVDGFEDGLKAFYPDGSLKYGGGKAALGAMALSSDGMLYGNYGYSKIMAVEASTGKVKWEWECPDAESGGNVECFYETNAPAIGRDGAVYVSSSKGKLYALSSQGQLKWTFSNNKEGSQGFFSGPSVGNDGTIYQGDNWFDFHAIGSAGTLQWKFKDNDAPQVNNTASVGGDGTVYLALGLCGADPCNNPHVIVLDKTGKLKWKKTTHMDPGYLVSPVIDSNGAVYVGSANGYLWIFDKSGKQLWRFKAGGSIGGGHALVPGGTLYLADNKGKFYALKTGAEPASSSWPKGHANLQNTGNAADTKNSYASYSPVPMANALFESSAHGDADKAKELLEKGADANVSDNTGTTALMRAAQMGYIRVVKALLKSGADANKANTYGNTALLFAVQFDNRGIAMMLVDAGADVSASNNAGLTPMTAASWYSYNDDLMNAMKSKGAQEPEKKVASVTDTDEYGNTPLHMAAFSCDTGKTEEIIKQGADINAKNEEGKTPLMFAVEGCSTDNGIVEYWDNKEYNSNYKTSIRSLIESGADVNAKDKYGESALFVAVRKNQIFTAEVLIKNVKADVNLKNKKGQSLLDVAKENPWDDMIKLVEMNMD